MIAGKYSFPFLRHSYKEKSFPHFQPLLLQNFRDEFFGSVSLQCPSPDDRSGRQTQGGLQKLLSGFFLLRDYPLLCLSSVCPLSDLCLSTVCPLSGLCLSCVSSVCFLSVFCLFSVCPLSVLCLSSVCPLSVLSRAVSALESGIAAIKATWNNNELENQQ